MTDHVYSSPPSRPGVLKVFWPAFLGWGAAAEPKALAAASWYLGWTSPALAREMVEILRPIGLAVAPFGALWVTSRYEAAKGVFPRAINFSVILAILSTSIVVM